MKDSSLVILLVFEQHNSWLCGRPPKLRDFASQTPDHKIPIASIGQQCDLATYIPKCPLEGWFHPIPSSLAGKESTCNAGHPSSIPGSGRSNGDRDRLPTTLFLGFPGGSAGRESDYNAGDLGSIPGLGRSHGEEDGSPLQFSVLENSMDCVSP